MREITPAEYKALKQYQSMGFVLDEFRAYGYRAGIESIIQNGRSNEENGHNWLIK